MRLSSHKRFPDFQIQVDDVIVDFEAVMVVTRPLGKEYRGDLRTGPIPTVAPAGLPPLDTGPIRTVVAKKASKRYQGKVHLLVYVNTKGSNAKYEVVSKAVRDTCGDSFESVWLLAYGRKAGSRGAVTNFVGCAKPSPNLAACAGWLPVPAIKAPGL